MASMICRHKCVESIYEPKKTVRGDLREKYKRCSHCYIFIKWEGIYCPCCCVRLKVSPRNNRARQRYAELKKEKKENKVSTKRLV